MHWRSKKVVDTANHKVIKHCPHASTAVVSHIKVLHHSTPQGVLTALAPVEVMMLITEDLGTAIGPRGTVASHVGRHERLTFCISTFGVVVHL